MSLEHAVMMAKLPRGLLLRVIVVTGLLAPLLWLAAIDRLLNHKR